MKRANDCYLSDKWVSVWKGFGNKRRQMKAKWLLSACLSLFEEYYDENIFSNLAPNLGLNDILNETVQQ